MDPWQCRAHHLADMKTKYGMGLGLNSMEGREAKHVFICKYSNNTVYQHRWQQIFMHEFVTLIWLHSRGLNIPDTEHQSDLYTKQGIYC